MIARTTKLLVCFICLSIAAFLFFYGRPLILLTHTKREFQNAPGIWIVPKPLLPVPATSPSAKYPTVSYFDYEFESSSPEIKEERKAENIVALNLSDCAGLVILKPQPSGSLTSLMQQSAPSPARYFEDAYGKEAVRSDYEFRNTILSKTPKDLSLFASPRQMVTNSVLLMLKSGESQRFKNGLYSFETSAMRGFQEGNIALDDGVIIQAFDHQDRLMTLIVARKPGKVCFGQPELNQIIFSLRPSPVSD